MDFKVDICIKTFDVVNIFASPIRLLKRQYNTVINTELHRKTGLKETLLANLLNVGYGLKYVPLAQIQHWMGRMPALRRIIVVIRQKRA